MKRLRVILVFRWKRSVGLRYVGKKFFTVGFWCKVGWF